MKPQSEYVREYRAKHGGSGPADKARQRANNAAAKWVLHTHPDLYRDLLAKARIELGLPVEIGPGGTFTKPIEHGTLGGSLAHKYRGEEPCEACLEARRRYGRERYARRKASQSTSSSQKKASA